jgi:3-hydroxyisobutyrate dehydrogenase
MPQDKIAVIGMGQMGSAMAERLIDSGHDVIGYDISEGIRKALTDRGVPVTESLREALNGRRIVLSSLPNPAAARGAFLGDQGALALAEKGSVFVDLSTLDPATIKEVDAAAVALGHEMIDCPVSGSPAEARQGKLILIAGGNRATIERLEPLILKLGESWRYTGGVGTAKVVKIVNNMMSMGNVLVAAEAFALGTAAGVEPQTLYDVIAISGGRSHHFTKRFPNALKGNFAPGFKMELGEKDMALGIELGRTLNQPTPAASMVREMFSVALAEGYAGQDVVALLDMYNAWTKKVAERKS